MTGKPSDALTKPRHPIRTTLIAAAITVGLSGLGVGGYAVASGLNEPEPVEVEVEIADEVAPAPVETSTPTPEPEPVVEPPAPPPPPAPAPAPGYTYGNYPPGATMPNLPGTDQPDTSACASSTGTADANGNPVCA